MGSEEEDVTVQMSGRLRWEVGGEFEWMCMPRGPVLQWPTHAVWYLLGRHAVAALMLSLTRKRLRTLWVPEYFCHDVTRYWREDVCMRVRFYRDDPCRTEPDWASLKLSAGDVVLAVNYFGVRDGAPWYQWQEGNRCLLLEDHTHDPVSKWARTSKAHYAFSSMRKTLPSPTGAILWSPRGLRLPKPPIRQEWEGSALKLGSMIAKAAYLSGAGGPDLKMQFRKLQLEGEERLEHTAISTLSPVDRIFADSGFPIRWRTQREANVRHLLYRLATWPAARPVFEKWPNGSVPFASVLVFNSAAARSRYRAILKRSDVYCPVHWPSVARLSRRAQELSERELTIPADPRYTIRDMDRISDMLLGR